MKIQSQFKDYYDHVAHIYGGGDPKIMYLRKRIDSRKIAIDTEIASGLPRSYDEAIETKFQLKIKWLSIAGKLYLLVSPIGDPYSCIVNEWTVLNQSRHPALWDYMHTPSRWRRSEVKVYVGRESSAALAISRVISAPVFTFTANRWDTVSIDENVPILSTTGIAALIPATQMYQDIAYFIGNTMKGSPDLMPATAQTDKEKICAAGFDLKQSFRHRM